MNITMGWIIKIEGGYVNDPHDLGGETNYGISKKTYPDVDIKNLTVEQAMAIYERNYWIFYNCNLMPPVAGILAMDAYVQHSPKTASRLLQEAVGATPDGIVGPITLKKIREKDPRQLMLNFIRERALYYHHITVARSKNAKFLKGWFRRLPMLQQHINDSNLLEKQS